MIEKLLLPNKISVYIIPMHHAPVVSIQAWVSCGSANEPTALAGVSHFLEHAVFKGTKKRGVGELAGDIEKLGGEINAFTSFNETAFYTTLASRYFDTGLDVISDMLLNPTFEADEIVKEREVVREEIKRAHDSPSKILSANLWSQAFQGSPYGRPVLGFDETVAKLDHRALGKYFRENYHAGTVSIFIVGDVEPKATLKKVAKAFGKIRRGKLPKILPMGRRLPGIQAKLAERDIQDLYLQIAFPAHPITHREVPALDLATSALGQGESSVLFQELVKHRQLAQETHLGLVSTKQCGLMVWTIQTTPEQAPEAVKEGLKILQSGAAGLSQSSIERIQSSMESDVVYGKETVEGYARRLGYYHTLFGDPNYESEYLRRALEITPDEATSSLQQVLAMSPICSAVQPISKPYAASDVKAWFHIPKRLPEQNSTEIPETQDFIQKQSGPVSIILKRQDALPLLSVRFLFRGGSRVERTGREWGLSNFFQRVWTSGTRNFSSLKIAERLESLGASIHSFSGRNSFGLHAECLRKHWHSIEPMLSEILLDPSFPTDEVELERKHLCRDIQTESDSPGQLCQLNFMAEMYPNHPYGRSAQGSVATVERLGREDFGAYHKEWVRQDNLVVSAAGAFETESWFRSLTELVHRLGTEGAPLPELATLNSGKTVRVRTAVKQPLYQTHLLVGFLGASYADADRYALKLLSSCLAGQGGRLFLELRDKRSLAYQVSPLQSDGPVRGIFGIYIGCSPEKYSEALSGIRTELLKVCERPISDAELKRAKEYWLGRFELDLQRYSSQTLVYGLDELNGLGYRHSTEVPALIHGLTASDLQRAAQRYLNPNTAVISMVHPTPIEPSALEKIWGARRTGSGPSTRIASLPA